MTEHVWWPYWYFYSICIWRHLFSSGQFSHLQEVQNCYCCVVVFSEIKIISILNLFSKSLKKIQLLISNCYPKRTTGQLLWHLVNCQLPTANCSTAKNYTLLLNIMKLGGLRRLLEWLRKALRLAYFQREGVRNDFWGGWYIFLEAYRYHFGNIFVLQTLLCLQYSVRIIFLFGIKKTCIIFRVIQIYPRTWHLYLPVFKLGLYLL